MVKKHIGILVLLFTMFISLTGCSQVGSKTANMSAIYVVTSVLSFALLLCYTFFIKKKEVWFLVLFSAVTVVNIGYLSISLSATLQNALFSNRIAYLGSVFLPVSMLMTILRICKIKLNKWLVAAILSVSAVVFLIAASPGYLDIYYKEVSLLTIGGATVLDKVYGPLHSVYLYYLATHFLGMIGIVIFARISKRIQSSAYAVIILCSVMINIGVWLMEQLVNIEFEVLSVSYIASELFLLGVSFMIQENSIKNSLIISGQTPKEDCKAVANMSSNTESLENELAKKLKEQYEYLCSRLYTLTPTEKEIYNLYINGSGIKDVMAALNIKENTVKYHNRNIYSKLGVKSRKQLIEIVKSAPVSE